MSKIWQAEKEYQLTKQKLKKQCLVQGTALGVLSMCNCHPGRRRSTQAKDIGKFKWIFWQTCARVPNVHY